MARNDVFLNINALSPADAVVTGQQDMTAATVPELVLGDTPTFNFYFTDNTNVWPSWAGNAAYTVTWALSDAVSGDFSPAATTGNATPITGGWSVVLPLNAYDLVGLLNTKRISQPYPVTNLWQQIRVADPSGNEVTRAMFWTPIRYRAISDTQNTESASPTGGREVTVDNVNVLTTPTAAQFYAANPVPTSALGSAANGELLIGNGTGFTKATLTAGTGVSITNGSGAITISATDGDITLDDGTAAAPSLKFTADTDTGIYRPSDNVLGISAGGVSRATFGATSAINGTTIPGSKTLVVTTDKLSALAATTSAELAGVISDETGSGALVFATSPTLTTPILGTPQSGTLSSCTGLPISTGVSGLGTGVATFLATPSSANLASAVTDETGTGALVFANTPTLVTPNIGAATGTSVNLSGAGTFGGNLTVSGTGTFTTGTYGVAIQTDSVRANSNAAGAQLTLSGYNADDNQSISLRESGASAINYYSIGGTTSSVGHRFFTGGVKASQTLKVYINDNGLFTTGNLTVSGTGTSSVAGNLNFNGTGVATPPSGLNYGIFPQSGLGLGINSVAGGVGVWLAANGAFRLNSNTATNDYTGFEFTNATIGITGSSAYVRAIRTASSGSPTDLAFGVMASGTLAEAARFKSNGNLLVGTTIDGGQKLQVSGTVSFTGDLYSASAGSTWGADSGATGFLVYGAGGGANANKLVLRTNSTTALTLDSSQRTIANGVFWSSSTGNTSTNGFNNATSIANNLISLYGSTGSANIQVAGRLTTFDGGSGYYGLNFQAPTSAYPDFSGSVSWTNALTLTSQNATFAGSIAIGNTVQTAAAVASTHKVTISIGGSTYYLLATNV